MWHIHTLLNFKLLDLPRTYHFSSVHSHINHHGAAMTHGTATATMEMRRDTARRSIGHGSRRCGRMVGRRAHPPKWFVFPFFHYIIQISTILQQATPCYCQQIWQSQQKSTVCSGHPTPYQQSPGTPENKCEYLFSGVVGVLWPPSHINPRHQVFVLVLRACGSLWLPLPINNPISPEIECPCLLLEAVGFLWARATATTVNNPQNPRNQAFTLVFSGCGLPATTTAKWPHSPWNWAQMLAFSGCGLPLVTFIHLPQNWAFALDFRGLGLFLAATIATTEPPPPEIERKMLNFGGCGSSTSWTAKLSTYRLDFAVRSIPDVFYSI